MCSPKNVRWQFITTVNPVRRKLPAACLRFRVDHAQRESWARGGPCRISHVPGKVRNFVRGKGSCREAARISIPGRGNRTLGVCRGIPRFAEMPQSTCLPRRRMKSTTPNKTARTPQISRIVVESITRSPSSSLSAVLHMLLIMGIRSRTRRVITGPMVTTKRVGRTQKKIGKTSFTASFEARSSAFCRVMVRR